MGLRQHLATYPHFFYAIKAGYEEISQKTAPLVIGTPLMNIPAGFARHRLRGVDTYFGRSVRFLGHGIILKYLFSSRSK
jgi:hypothetical protein